MRRLAFAMATALAATPAAAADWNGVTWQAYSSISIAITGDIVTRPDEIVFGNGARLSVKVLHEALPGQWSIAGDEVGEATILEVVPPDSNPVLGEGNRLCGRPYTYLSLWEEPQGGLALTVYWGEQAPRNAKGDDVCAAYFYGRAN